MEYQWYLKKFDELSLDELYRILQLRIAIFVLEQKCIYVDLDDGDQEAYHLFAKSGDQIITYLRIHTSISNHAAVIRRVVVHKDFRQQKLGLLLMQKALNYLESLKLIDSVALSAQFHLQDFYQKMGFVSQGEPYDDVGILHIKMKKKLEILG